MKVSLEDRAHHGNRLFAQKFLLINWGLNNSTSNNLCLYKLPSIYVFVFREM